MATEAGVYNGSYSIALSNWDTGSLLVAASYTSEKGDRYDAQVGHWSYWTQAIGNAFPPWHAARRIVMGKTQTFLNAAGIGVEGVHQEMLKLRRNSFLATADLFQPDRAYRVPITTELRINQQDFETYNVLVNPDYSLQGLAREQLPLAWSKRGAATTGTVATYWDDAFAGSACVRMAAADGEECYLHQGVPLSFGETVAGEQQFSMTGSIWVLLPYDTTGTVGWLSVMLVTEEGLYDLQRIPLPAATEGAWRRLSVTTSTTKRIVRAELTIHLRNETGSSVEMFVDAAQLEAGDQARPWAPNPYSRPAWLQRAILEPLHITALGVATERTVGSVTYDQVPHTKVWVIPDTEDWWFRALPTRVGTMEVHTGELTSDTKNIWGFRAEPEDRSRRTTRVQIGTNTVDLVDNLTPTDIYYSYRLGENYLDHDGVERFGLYEDEDTGFSRSLEALTVHRDRLWVVSKETLNGTTGRYLKIARPHSNAYALADEDIDDYVEVLADFDMGMETGVCTAVGFAEGRDDLMLLTIAGVTYEAPVFYDYAYFTQEHTKEVLLRHAYEDNTLVLD